MKKTSKIISTLSALSMLASMCVMPAAHAEDGYTFDRSGANFVAGTDFENNLTASNFETASAGNFLSDDRMWGYNSVFKTTQKHSGNYSLYSGTGMTGNAGISTASGTWSYWNKPTHALEIGKTYKYSYWVYADEAAEVTTPNLLVKKLNGGYEPWLINNINYASLPKKQWNYFEGIFTAETTDLPFFYNIPANLYIDDIKLEEVVAPQMTATTLPDEGTDAALGYNEYTMTFDKDIASATVTINGTTVTSTVDGKTVNFGTRNTTAGSKTIVVSVTDTDGATATVEKTVTVPDTLVYYADFDKEAPYSPWHYFGEGQAQLSFTSVAYCSPSQAVKFDSANPVTYMWLNISNGMTLHPKSIVNGQSYKVSFKAKRVDSTTTPKLQFIYNNVVRGSYSITSDTMENYQLVFTADASGQRPGFYQGATGGDVIMDDFMIEEYTLTAPQMVSTTLPADGKTDTVGRKRYTMTFDKNIASATVKVVTSPVTSTISEDKKTVSFEVLFDGAGEKTVTVDVKDTDGATTQVTRTFTIRDTWVAFTDFENKYNVDYILTAEWAFMNNLNDGGEISTAQVHSGAYSFYSNSGTSGNATINSDWDYWKISPRSLEIGKTYKYSYWVYADAEAEVTTPKVLVKKSNGGYEPYIINNGNEPYTSLEKQQWNYFEGIFTAETTELPFFWSIPANLYIDDILLEEIPTANVVSTTLPGEGTNVALGYNEYTMTFDKEIKSANVTYNGKTTDAVVSADGKTITFGIAAVKDGNVVITITDVDGLSSSVTKAITVPDTLVMYTGFDKGGTAGRYISNDGYTTPLNTTDYRSPGAAALLKTDVQYCESIDFTRNGEPLGSGVVNDSNVYWNEDNWFTAGQWYKVSFYAKAAVEGQKPQIGIARRNASGQGEGYGQIELNDTMTKYEVTFKAISDKKPFLYREDLSLGEIIIDDVLIEEVEAPIDYSYELSAKKITAGAAITATLTNEKSAEAINGVALVALYKDGVMQTCSMTTVTNLAKGEKITTDAVTVPSNISDGEYTVKAFLWDNATTSMAPICNALQISEPVAAQ